MGATLKFWRRSRVPKKGSRNEAVEIFLARRQISRDYYTIPSATQARINQSILSILIDLILRLISIDIGNL